MGVLKRKATRQIARPKKKARVVRHGGRLTRVTRSRLPVASQVHSFVRYATPGLIAGNVAHAPFLGWYGPRLDFMSNSSEFTNLFDQYRINFVVYKFYLRIDPSAQTAATASFPKLYWYRDYDDSNIPGSLNEIRENGRCKMAILHPNRAVTIAFKPNVLNLMYYSGVSNQFSPNFKAWIDVAKPDCQYYGIKAAIDNLTNTNYMVDIECKYYIQCKNTR